MFLGVFVFIEYVFPSSVETVVSVLLTSWNGALKKKRKFDHFLR